MQENAPERLDLKLDLYGEIDAVAGPDVVIASSSSGLMPTELQQGCARHPERVLVGHPFNPPHLIPLVEVVGGEATSEAAIEQAMATYASIGKSPIRIRVELPGHVTNRLQAALWREAYWLVEQGVVSVADVDRAISSGPGLRWALLGPFATQHLSGGDGGNRPRARASRPADGRVVGDDAVRRVDGRAAAPRSWRASTTNSTASTSTRWPTSATDSSNSSSSPRPDPPSPARRPTSRHGGP